MYNPNLHKVARYDRMEFTTKNSYFRGIFDASLFHLQTEVHLEMVFTSCFRVLSPTPKYTGSSLQRVKDAKETACYKWVLVVTELLNIAVNDFDAKKSARYSWVRVVTGLVVGGTQCKCARPRRSPSY